MSQISRRFATVRDLVWHGPWTVYTKKMDNRRLRKAMRRELQSEMKNSAATGQDL